MREVNIFAGSGGGLKGIFQCAILQELTKAGVYFDGFAGVSTGSIQCGFMSLAKEGMENQKIQVENLINLWSSLQKDKDIYSKPILGKFGIFVKAIFKKPSMFTFKGLSKLLEENIDDNETPQRPVILGVVKLSNGKFLEIRPYDGFSLKKGILASSSIPAFLPPVAPDLVDGGVRDIAPLNAACGLMSDLVNKISSMEQIPKDQIKKNVYMVLCTPLKAKRDARNWMKASMTSIGSRSLGLLENENYNWDIKHTLRMNEILEVFEKYPDIPKPEFLRGKTKIDNLYIIQPKVELFSALEFSQKLQKQLFEHGLEVAEDFLAQNNTP